MKTATQCVDCPNERMLTGEFCLRCYVKRALKRNRMWSYVGNNKKRLEKLYAAYTGRFTAVLWEQGFRVSEMESADTFVHRAAPWARTKKMKDKLARIMHNLDDRAVRYRMILPKEENLLEPFGNVDICKPPWTTHTLKIKEKP